MNDDKTVSREYIYPDCTDTSTYIKQRYSAFHVAEYFFVHSKLMRKRVLDKNGYWVLNETIYNSKGKGITHTDTIRGDLPDVVYDVNDSMAVNVAYYQDGGLHICTYGFNRANECKHTDILAATIVFDSLYKSKMEGPLQIICDSNTITDAFTNEELIKVIHRERQTGMWRTYNIYGGKTDSAIYKPE